MPLDSEWQRINEDTNLDGDRQQPQFARNFRSDGGMVIGRVLRTNNRFYAQVFRHGQFEGVNDFATFDEAVMTLRKTINTHSR